MWQTAEIRWFHQGNIPADILEWFCQSAPQPDQYPSRTDYYFHLFSCNDTLGIKLREGRVEIKQRTHQHGVIHLHEQVVGAMEAWQKWSFSLSQADDILPVINASPLNWVEVDKARQQQQYQITGNNQIVALSVDTPVEQGCNLELTQIQVDGKAWWTVGFESFGDESALESNLLLTARHIFAKNRPPRLRMLESYSYPGWLEIIGVH